MNRTLLVTLAALAGAVSAHADGEKARELLVRSMARRPITNIRAVITQRAGYESNVMQQVKVEMSKDGKVHQLVLAPLSLQGLERVDDTVYVKTFSPDDRSLIVQPSVKRDQDDVQFRMALVDRNYSLKIERKERIAGRNAVVVAAVPKFRELETRCYAIDEKTGFVLRLETCRPGSEPMLHFDTKMVEYPASFDQDTFKIDSKWTSTKIYEKQQQIVVRAASTAPEVGFRAVMPRSLPFGFAVQEVNSDTRSQLPSISVRMTDGLASATVYQWPSQGKSKLPAPLGTVVREINGIRLLIAGDIPEKIKQKLIDSFVQSAKSGKFIDPSRIASWAQELGCRLSAFPIGRDGVDGTIFVLHLISQPIG